MTFGTVKANTIENSNGQTGNAIGPGFKNRIINGDMRIDQRNAGASVNLDSGGVYPVDRWRCDEVSDGAATGEQVQDAPTGFVDSLKITTTTADGSLSASQYMGINQFIEGYNTADFGFGTASAKTITLSFWVKSSLTGTFAGGCDNADNNRSYIFNYTINSANTWEYKTVSIAGDTTGTWGTTNGRGVSVRFALGAGTDYNGTVGAWQSGLKFSSSGATSVIGTLNATFYITGVQLEVGPSATSFDYRPYGTELSLCQRYCTVYTGVVYGYYQFGTAYSTTRAITMVGLPVTMRTTPALSTTGNFRLHDAVTTTAVTAFAITNSSDNIFGIDSTVASGLTQYRPYFLGSNNDTTAKLIASAEL